MNDGVNLSLNFGQKGQKIPGGFGTGMLIKGLTPYIGPNGNWWTGEQDTGVAAEGKTGKDGRDGIDGAPGKDGIPGKDGADGLTPYIGPNGNWWVGERDTGVLAAGSVGDAEGVADVQVESKLDAAGDLKLRFTVHYANGTKRIYGESVPLDLNGERTRNLVKILHAGDDGYLYRTASFDDAANRLTLQELKDLLARYIPLEVEWFRAGQIYYRMSVTTASFGTTYGWVAANLAVAGSASGAAAVFYTAEYVAAEVYASYDDRYLYRVNDFSDAANRLTLQELQEIVLQNGRIALWVKNGEELICWETKDWCISDGYGFIRINDDANDGEGKTPFFTAEYIPDREVAAAE